MIKKILPLLFLFASTMSIAERVRLDREHGAVNDAFQSMLADQISSFSGGVGKIELGRESGNKGDCVADLFVSPETTYVTLESKKSRAEFYIDHPHDSFKDVLFQALIKQGNEQTLSVDKKTGGYKVKVKGSSLELEVTQKGETFSCSFELDGAILVGGETE